MSISVPFSSWDKEYMWWRREDCRKRGSVEETSYILLRYEYWHLPCFSYEQQYWIGHREQNGVELDKIHREEFN